MPRFTRIATIAGIAAAATALIAQPPQGRPAMPTTPPGTDDPTRVTAGTYRIDPNHTQALFQVDHLGFNPYYGILAGGSGTLTLDPGNPTAATVDVTLPVSSVKTTSTKLDEKLVSPQFFDAAKFPTMRFRSTKVEVQGGTARITGDLTLHGVTRPVVLEALFHGAGKGMGGRGDTIGFEGRARIKRSEFGVTYGIPIVSDEVAVVITIAFEKG